MIKMLYLFNFFKKVDNSHLELDEDKAHLKNLF